MLISVCIPTYNRPKSLLNCLNSLSLQTDLDFEVCISDNCSHENIERILAYNDIAADASSDEGNKVKFALNNNLKGKLFLGDNLRGPDIYSERILEGTASF